VGKEKGAFAGAQVDRPAVRGASGMVTILPPLRVIVSVRWPDIAQRQAW